MQYGFWAKCRKCLHEGRVEDEFSRVEEYTEVQDLIGSVTTRSSEYYQCSKCGSDALTLRVKGSREVKCD